MENASKALIMACGVLIGMLILTLAVYLFSSFGVQSHRIHQRIEDNQVLQYNRQYAIYAEKGADGKPKEVTIHQIITLMHLANANNEKYKEDNEVSFFKNNYETTVTCKVRVNNSIKTYNNNTLTNDKEADILNGVAQAKNPNSALSGSYLLENNSYKCTGIEYHKNTGRIKAISFEPTN